MAQLHFYLFLIFLIACLQQYKATTPKALSSRNTSQSKYEMRKNKPANESREDLDGPLPGLHYYTYLPSLPDEEVYPSEREIKSWGHDMRHLVDFLEKEKYFSSSVEVKELWDRRIKYRRTVTNSEMASLLNDLKGLKREKGGRLQKKDIQDLLEQYFYAIDLEVPLISFNKTWMEIAPESLFATNSLLKTNTSLLEVGLDALKGLMQKKKAFLIPHKQTPVKSYSLPKIELFIGQSHYYLVVANATNKVYDRTFNFDHCLYRNRSTVIPLFFEMTTSSEKDYEVSYFDSYFIFRGLLAVGKISDANKILLNWFQVIDRYGYVPYTNRLYSLDRTGPPLLPYMVLLSATYLREHGDVVGGSRVLLQALPRLLREHFGFWMNPSTGRAVHLEEGTVEKPLPERLKTVRDVVNATYFGEPILHRYYSTVKEPRSEHYTEDSKILNMLKKYNKTIASGSPDEVMRSIRAAMESGVGLSSRWHRTYIENRRKRDKLSKEEFYAGLDTTSIIPAELNAMLIGAEFLISAIIQYLKLGDDFAQYMSFLGSMHYNTMYHYLHKHQAVLSDWDIRKKKISGAHHGRAHLGLQILDDHIEPDQRIETDNGVITTSVHHTGFEQDEPYICPLTNLFRLHSGWLVWKKEDHSTFHKWEEKHLGKFMHVVLNHHKKHKEFLKVYHKDGNHPNNKHHEKHYSPTSAMVIDVLARMPKDFFKTEHDSIFSEYNALFDYDV